MSNTNANAMPPEPLQDSVSTSCDPAVTRLLEQAIHGNEFMYDAASTLGINGQEYLARFNRRLLYMILATVAANDNITDNQLRGLLRTAHRVPETLSGDCINRLLTMDKEGNSLLTVLLARHLGKPCGDQQRVTKHLAVSSIVNMKTLAESFSELGDMTTFVPPVYSYSYSRRARNNSMNLDREP